MRLHEGKLKEFDLLLQEIGENVTTARAHFNLESGLIELRFTLKGEEGVIVMAPRTTKWSERVACARRKLVSAAYSELRTRPKSVEEARRATQTVHRNAIRILTSTKELKLISASWDTLLMEWGTVVPGVNTTDDVGPDEITKQAKKFGNKVDRNGKPPLLRDYLKEDVAQASIAPRIGAIVEVEDERMGRRTYRVAGYMKDAPEPKYDTDSEDWADLMVDEVRKGKEGDPLGAILDSGNRRFKNGKRKMWCSRKEAQFVTGKGISGGIFSLDEIKVIGMVNWDEKTLRDAERQAQRFEGTILF